MGGVGDVPIEGEKTDSIEKIIKKSEKLST